MTSAHGPVRNVTSRPIVFRAARRTFREFLLRRYGTEAALQAAWQQPDIHFDDLLEPARFRREEVSNLLSWAGKPAAAGTLAALEFSIWDMRKSKLLKTLRHDGADALARGWRGWPHWCCWACRC